MKTFLSLLVLALFAVPSFACDYQQQFQLQSYAVPIQRVQFQRVQYQQYAPVQFKSQRFQSYSSQSQFVQPVQSQTIIQRQRGLFGRNTTTTIINR